MCLHACMQSITDIIEISEECEESFHTLIKGLPITCKEDWSTIDLMLSDGYPREVSRWTCETYCLNPLKMSTETCPGLEHVYRFILGLCSRNNKGDRYIIQQLSNEYSY